MTWVCFMLVIICQCFRVVELGPPVPTNSTVVTQGQIFSSHASWPTTGTQEEMNHLSTVARKALQDLPTAATLERTQVTRTSIMIAGSIRGNSKKLGQKSPLMSSTKELSTYSRSSAVATPHLTSSSKETFLSAYSTTKLLRKATSFPLSSCVAGDTGKLASSVATATNCNDALGMESSDISDGQITASTVWDVNHAAVQGRLHYLATPGKAGSWSARFNNLDQWFQIDLGNQLTKLTGLATQGRNNFGQWVTKYKVQYSDDGANFRYYSDQCEIKEFLGNTDQDTVVRHRLYSGIRARYIRFRPTAWHSHISMRVEVYGCKVPRNDTGVTQEHIVTSCSSFPKTSTQQESTFSSTAAPTTLQVTRNTNMVSGVTGVISKQLGHTFVLITFLKELPTHLPSAAMATPQLTGTFKTTFFSGRATSNLLGKTTFTSLSSHNTADSIGITAKDCNDALGMESGVISDGQITASTVWNVNHAAVQGRLHYLATPRKAGSWSAMLNNLDQWLQIDLGNQLTKITGLATQGRNNFGQWVTKYKVQYSDDGANFRYYSDQCEIKEFLGNTDQDTVVRHRLYSGIRARYIRFRPTAWHSHISMRVEVYGCKVPRNDTGVTQEHMVTSCPSFPKTSTQQESTFSSTAAPTTLQVTRNTNMVSGVTGVISKQLGHTSVLMSFLKELPTRSPSAAIATPQLTGTFKTTFFSGRATSNLLGKTTFTSLSSHNTADSIGITAKDCNDALGMESGVISDGQITASTVWDVNHAAVQGRLHYLATPHKAGSWSAMLNNLDQWFQIDLGNQLTKITGVATQGRNNFGQWVTKYKVQYSDDGANFRYYSDQCEIKEFLGNTDADTVVRHRLYSGIRARYIRFRPTAWHSHISMRVEVYGCKVPRNDTGATQGHMVTSCPSFPKTSTQQESTFLSTAAPTTLQVTRTTNMVSGVIGVISKQMGGTSVLMSFLKELPTRLPSTAMATPLLTGTFKTTLFSGSATSNLLGKATFTSSSSYTTAGSIGVTAKEFHFVLRLLVRSANFTLDYANTSTSLHNHLKAKATNQVTIILKGSPGFISAEFKRFGPYSLPSKSKASLMVEMIITHQENSRGKLLEKLKQEYANPNAMFDPEHFETLHTFNSTCPPPVVKVNLTKNLDQAPLIFTASSGSKTGKRFQFHAQVKHSSCSQSLPSKMSWEVTKAILNSGTFRSFLKRPLTTHSVKLKLYQGRSLDGYVYISFVLRNTVDNRVVAYDYGYVLLLRPPPIARIFGVSRAVKGNGSVLLSALADHSRAHIPRLTYSWYCRKRIEKLPLDELKLVDVPDGNSNNSGGCFGYGPGRLSGGDVYLHVDVDKMLVGEYVFIVKVKLDSKTSKDDHNLTVLEPQINILVRCTYNCYPRVDINEKTTFEANCSGLTCKSITRYQWALYQIDQQSPEPLWIPIKNIAAKATFDGLNFVLRGKINATEYSLELNTTYKAELFAFIDERQVAKGEIQITTNSPPVTYYGGGCLISPSEGLALQTNFLVNCSQWYDEDPPLSYTFSYMTSKLVAVDLKSGSSLPSLTTVLPQGDPSRDYNITIQVAIHDSLGATSHDIKFVTVRPSLTTLAEISKDFIDGPDNALDKALSKGDVGLAAGTATLVLTSIEDGEMETQEKNQVKDAFIHKLGDVEVKNMQEVKQLSYFLTEATEGREDVSISVLNNSVNLLETMTDYLWKSVNEGGYDKDAVQSVGGVVFKGISNTIGIITADKGANYEGTEFEKNATENTLSLIDKLGATLLSTKAVGEEPSSLNTSTLLMILDRQKPAIMGNRTLGTQQEKRVILPSSETLFANDNFSSSYVDAQMLLLNQNPYTWDESSKNISSPVIKFELKTEEGSLMNISDLKEPLSLFLPVIMQTDGEGNDSSDHLFIKPGNTLQYHKVYLDSDDTMAFVKLRPSNDTAFDVFVSGGRKPTERNHSLSKRIPDLSSCTPSYNKRTYLNCTRSAFVFFFSSTLTGQTGVHYIGIRLANTAAIPSRNNSKVTARKTRSCRVGCGREKRSYIRLKYPPTTSPPTTIIIPQYNGSTDVNYTILVTMPECVYWSVSKQAWIKDGCKLGSKTTKEQLHCLCNHLSAFGGSIFVAPNPIDFDTVFIKFTKLAETKNVVVLATVCVIIGIYFIGLVFARRADKNDNFKVVAHVLLGDGSVESNGYQYDISIQTGMWNDFGTTAKVGMIISGKEGSSNVLSLNDMPISRKFFSRASVNNFTIFVKKSLGDLTGVYVWHDNSGRRPSWYLQQILITDVQTKKEWYFFANQWLALDKGAGVTQLHLKVAEGKELIAFKNLFISRVSRSLGEGHLWISVFTRPSHNPFTRCQRLSCCLSFLFAAMVTNAMFYQFDKPLTDTFKLGPLTISWTQIKIGIQSSVICIPINFLMVIIFQNIKQADSYDSFVLDGNKSQRSGFLPHFVLYIAWALCFLVSITGALFTILYSMQWGADKSNQWVTSISVSLAQDVLISQPIKVVALATLLSFIIRKPPKIDSVVGPSFYKNKLGSKASCLSPTDLKREKEQSIKSRKALEASKEILTFLVFAFLLMVICYGNQDVARYHITKAVNDSFAADFEEVTDTASFWEWIEGNLITGLYDATWYNGRQFEYKEGYISNHEEFMLGMPRLRQLRLKLKQCYLNDALNFKDRFKICRPAYSSDDEDRAAFNLPGWIPVTTHNKSHNPYELYPQAWRYQSKETLESLSYLGYEGGGYVASLGYNSKTAIDVARDLKEHEWIDESTAVVFIEFTLFNPATSLFTFGKYTFETQRTGGAVANTYVTTLSLYPSSNNNFQSFYEVCQLVFLIVIVVCFIVELVKLMRQKTQYLRQLWNWIELLLLVVCTLAVVTSFLKGKYTTLYVRNVQENPYETFSPDYLLKWSSQEIGWLAATIFILTLKLLRLIRFNKHICQMQGTMKRSARPLISFVFVFGIGIMAFTYFACIAFGSQASTFSSLFNSVKTNLLMSIGKQVDYMEIYLMNSQVELIFFSLYFVFTICILMSIFVAVIADSYIEIREDHGEDFQDAEVGSFMFDNFSRKVKQLPQKFTFAVKHIFNLSCADLKGNDNDKARRKKSKRFSTSGRSTRRPDVDENSKTDNELNGVISSQNDDHFKDKVQEKKKTIYARAKIIEIEDIMDDYYLHEVRNQLMYLVSELISESQVIKEGRCN